MIVKFKHHSSERCFYVESATVSAISDETYLADEPNTRVWLNCGEFFDVGYPVEVVRNMLNWDK